MTDGYEIPLHRSLAEPILMAGAPRAAAIALGLRLWIPGLVTWAALHSASVFLARIDPDFVAVTLRAARQREHLAC